MVLTIYDRTGEHVVHTERAAAHDLGYGPAAYISETAYAALAAGETYRYELTVNGAAAVSGTITMPGSADALRRVDGEQAVLAKIGEAAYGTLARAIAAVSGIQTEADRTITLLADTDEAITVTKSMTIDRQNGAKADNLTHTSKLVQRVTDEAYRFFYEGFAIAYDAAKKTVSVEYHFESATTGRLLIAAYDAGGRMVGLTSTEIKPDQNGILKPDGKTDPIALKTIGAVAEIRVFLVAADTYAPLHEHGEQKVV